MKVNIELKSANELMQIFLSNADDCIKLIEPGSPFTINVNGEKMYVYIKNLTPAHLSNNNPDIWRIQLNKIFKLDIIKKSEHLFILFGYDSENKVFTSWNPFWCKQRINIGKSVSLYSRLSLQKRVSENLEIESYALNNKSNVVCIPEKKISYYINNIRKYYPEKTLYISTKSNSNKCINLMEQRNNTYEIFINSLDSIKEFRDYMIGNKISLVLAKKYAVHVKNLIKYGYIDKYKDIFLNYNSLTEYPTAINEYCQIEEISLLNKRIKDCYKIGLQHYINFLLLKNGQNPLDITNNDEEKENSNGFKINKFGKLRELNVEIKQKLKNFIIGEDYPDYDEMINIAREYYPQEINKKMNYADWIKLFENTSWSKKN